MKADQQQSDSDSNDDQEESVGERHPLTVAARSAITVAIIVHLMAVVLPPLAFQAAGPLGSSPSVGTLLQTVEGYSQFTYMNRGYAFFAPDPGPSHLIQAAVFEPSGSRTEVMFPDLKKQWPRLLYHRHFMLAEYLTTIYTPKGPPQELIDEDPQAAFAWEQARGRYENVRQSITDHLKHINSKKHVVIRRIEHAIPSFIEYVDQQIDLSDPELYIVLLDLSPDEPMGPPESIPIPDTASADDAQNLKAPKQGPPNGQGAKPENPSDDAGSTEGDSTITPADDDEAADESKQDANKHQQQINPDGNTAAPDGSKEEDDTASSVDKKELSDSESLDSESESDNDAEPAAENESKNVSDDDDPAEDAS